VPRRSRKKKALAYIACPPSLLSQLGVEATGNIDGQIGQVCQGEVMKRLRQGLFGPSAEGGEEAGRPDVSGIVVAGARSPGRFWKFDGVDHAQDADCTGS